MSLQDIADSLKSSQWAAIVSVAVVIGAVVGFFKTLVDIIKGWLDALKGWRERRERNEQAQAKGKLVLVEVTVEERLQYGKALPQPSNETQEAAWRQRAKAGRRSAVVLGLFAATVTIPLLYYSLRPSSPDIPLSGLPPAASSSPSPPIANPTYSPGGPDVITLASPSNVARAFLVALTSHNAERAQRLLTDASRMSTSTDSLESQLRNFPREVLEGMGSGVGELKPNSDIGSYLVLRGTYDGPSTTDGEWECDIGLLRLPSGDGRLGWRVDRFRCRSFDNVSKTGIDFLVPPNVPAIQLSSRARSPTPPSSGTRLR